MNKQQPGAHHNKKPAKNTRKDNKNQSTSKSSSLEIYTKELETLISKFTELADQNTKDESNINALREECDKLQEEKCRLFNENRKHVMERNHLESFCRVLHDQNKRDMVGSTKTTSEKEEPKEGSSSMSSTDTPKEEPKQSTPMCSTASASEIVNMINCSHEDKDASEQPKYQTFIFAFDSHKDELNQIDKHMNEERQFTKAKLSQMQSERVLWVDERANLIEALNNNETNINELKSEIEDLNKEIETFENYAGDYNQAMCNTNENFLNSVKETRALTRKLYCLFKKTSLFNNNIRKTITETFSDILDTQIYETKLKKSIEKVKPLKTQCCQLLDERNTLLRILQANNIPTKPQIQIKKKEMPPIQREMLVKGIKCQLEAILKTCTTSKDKMSIEALLHVLKHLKLQNEVNCAIHLCLGYINVKFSHMKECQFQQNLLKELSSTDCSCYDDNEPDSSATSS